MKRVLFLLLPLLCLASIAHAQFPMKSIYTSQAAVGSMTMGAQNGQGVNVVVDTLKNADTSYLYTRVQNGTWDLLFRAKNTKLTGTPAGSIYLQGCLDTGSSALNATWYTMANDHSQAVMKDTGTIVNGNTDLTWICKSCPFSFYRFEYITTGTQTSSPSGTVYGKK